MELVNYPENAGPDQYFSIQTSKYAEANWLIEGNFYKNALFCRFFDPIIVLILSNLVLPYFSYLTDCLCDCF